jgi:hypothetical protein
LDTDIILGKGIFDGSVLEDIDYSERKVSEVKQYKDYNNMFKVTPNDPYDANINISAGKVIIDGKPIEYAGGTLNIPIISVGADRNDLVTIDNTGTINLIQGTSDSSFYPEVPSNEYLICVIERTDTATVVTGADIKEAKEYRVEKSDQTYSDPLPYFINYGTNQVRANTKININGTNYIYETATTISGTPSEYLKINGSTYAPSYVSDLTGVSWDESRQGYYDTSNNKYIFDEFKALDNGDITTLQQEPSVSLAKSLINSGRKFELITMFPFISSTSLYSSGDILHSGKYIAVIDSNTSRLYIITMIDNLPASTTNITLSYSLKAVDLISLNDSDFVLVSANSKKMQTYRVSPTGSLTTVGNELTHTLPCIEQTIKVAKLTENRIAVCYYRSSNNALEVQAFDFDGTNWSTVGSTYAYTSVAGYYPSGCLALNSTEIIVTGQVSPYGIKLTFNGSSWVNNGDIVSDYNGFLLKSAITQVSEKEIIIQRVSGESITVIGATLDGLNLSYDYSKTIVNLSDSSETPTFTSRLIRYHNGKIYMAQFEENPPTSSKLVWSILSVIPNLYEV